MPRLTLTPRPTFILIELSWMGQFTEQKCTLIAFVLGVNGLLQKGTFDFIVAWNISLGDKWNKEKANLGGLIAV